VEQNTGKISGSKKKLKNNVSACKIQPWGRTYPEDGAGEDNEHSRVAEPEGKEKGRCGRSLPKCKRCPRASIAGAKEGKTSYQSLGSSVSRPSRGGGYHWEHLLKGHQEGVIEKVRVCGVRVGALGRIVKRKGRRGVHLLSYRERMLQRSEREGASGNRSRALCKLEGEERVGGSTRV